MFGLAREEESLLRSLSTPQAVQDFLDALPLNHEKDGDTCMSPRRVLRERKAHCIEGAFLAALAFWLHGKAPLLLDLRSAQDDDDHVIALFREGGCYGAVSKTNHAVLRYRDPLYRTPRELALSYFHEYFLNTDGRKTLESYSRPFDLRLYEPDWVTAEFELWDLANALDGSRHYPLVPKSVRRMLRTASPIERKAGELVEWPKSDPRT